MVLAWTDDETDPQYPLSQQTLAYLEGETDARGRKLVIHKLPIPDHPVCITEEELAGYSFAEGEEEREAGERLAASYVNFIFPTAVILRRLGRMRERQARGRTACAVESGRKIIPVQARAILVGGGNIHCITQQIPAAKSERVKRGTAVKVGQLQKCSNKNAAVTKRTETK